MDYTFVKKYLDEYYFKYNIFNNKIRKDFEIPDILKNEYNFIKNTYSKKCNLPVAKFLIEYYKKTNDYKQCSIFIKNEYEDGYGIKYIANKLNISYTQCRNVLLYLNIEIRRGNNIITDKLLKFRKEKALYERNNHTGWLSKDVIEKRKIKSSNKKGIQGFYFNKSLQKNVWLRSSYEFIFSEWLDHNDYIWDIEVKTFNIGDELYRPDFFIFDDNMKLKKIIEVKGYWDNRSYKVNELKKILPDIEIIFIGINNNLIQNYIIEDNKKYKDKLKQWKQIRIMNL